MTIRRATLQDVESILARQQGYTHLRLYSSAARFDEILRFYRDCGFHPWYLEMTMDLAECDEDTGRAPADL